MCELIVDGFHVHPNVIRTTWKCLGAERLILITDAMPGKGIPDGSCLFSNLDCVKSGNSVRVRQTGRIAGSAITMLDAISNMHAFTGAFIDELVRMTCIHPTKTARVFDTKGSLAPGKDADLIVLDDNLSLQMTWVGGQCLVSNR